MRDETFIGRVRGVLGSQVTIELDSSLAGVAPIYKGKLHNIAQVGSLVRLPQGMVDLIATVTLVGITEPPASHLLDEAGLIGTRVLQLNLLGEIDRGTGRFRRGVGSYPGLDDAAHFIRPEELASVYPSNPDLHLPVGKLSAADSVMVSLDVGKLVTRHSAIVGSTGSGKTSAVATILQGLAGGGWPAANVVVIDPHGEYAAALGEAASVRSVLEDSPRRVHVPFWALSADAILKAFSGSEGGLTTQRIWASLVLDARREYAQKSSWLQIDSAAITPDTPIPFDIFAAWYRFDYENRETRTVKSDPATTCLESAGDAKQLIPAKFTPHAPGGASPMQAPSYGLAGSAPDSLRLGLKDPRLAFLLDPELDREDVDPLVSAIDSWVGGTKSVSILDFAGLPDHAADFAIGVILKLLFEVSLRTPPGDVGIGRPSPVLVVLEEAHRFLGGSGRSLAGDAADRIAREGRKYGIGLMLVSQRPSDLPDTVLAQCGTIVALRLSNSADQGRVRTALPDSVGGLAETLPSLRTGEAVISGEALVLPSRTMLDRPHPLPHAEDPSIVSWRQPAHSRSVSAALEIWRNVYGGKK